MRHQRAPRRQSGSGEGRSFSMRVAGRRAREPACRANHDIARVPVDAVVGARGEIANPRASVHPLREEKRDNRVVWFEIGDAISDGLNLTSPIRSRPPGCRTCIALYAFLHLG